MCTIILKSKKYIDFIIELQGCFIGYNQQSTLKWKFAIAARKCLFVGWNIDKAFTSPILNKFYTGLIHLSVLYWLT